MADSDQPVKAFFESGHNGNGRHRHGSPEEMVQNAMMMRQEWFEKFLDPRRDIAHECGFPRTSTLTAWNYQDLYDREAVAARVVEVFPRECWQVTPTVYESADNEEVTEFEDAWDALGSTLRGEESYYMEEECSPVWEYLQRADELSGIGHYGVILLGLDDGEDLSEPVKKASKLEYLRVFPESLAQITQFEANRDDPRYGQPTQYLITFNDPREGATSGIGMTTATRNVHWSRVVHVVDNLASSEWAGVPRMRPVLNNLLTIQKLSGGSGEMYWRGAFPGLALETHPQLGGDVKVDIGATRDFMEQYMNGLQRYLLLMGMSAKTLSPTVVDPTPYINAQIELICIKLGCPVRIFKGSERGELASSQDDAAWNDRLKFRQRHRITPRVLIPFVDRLINLGVLPSPKKDKKGKTTENQLARRYGPGTHVKRVRNRLLVVNAKGRTIAEESASGYRIEWPDLTSQSDAERADVAGKKTTAITQYISGEGAKLYPPFDFLTRVMGESEDDAAAIVEASEELAEEKAEEEELKAQEEQQAAEAPPGEAGGYEDTGAGQSEEEGGESEETGGEGGGSESVGSSPPPESPESTLGYNFMSRDSTRRPRPRFTFPRRRGSEGVSGGAFERWWTANAECKPGQTAARTKCTPQSEGEKGEGEGGPGGGMVPRGGGKHLPGGGKQGALPDAKKVEEAMKDPKNVKEFKPGVNKVETPEGDVVVKTRPGNHESAKTEKVIGDLAEQAGVKTPKVEPAVVNGKPGGIQSFVPGKDMSKMEPAERTKALKDMEADGNQVTKHVMFDYLVGHSDGHAGNFIQGEDGSFVGIDKELTFGKGNRDEKVRHHPKSILNDLAGGPDKVSQIPLDPKMVSQMAKDGRAMVAKLKKEGNAKAAREMLNRIEVLEQFVKNGGKTMGDLESASKSPPQSLGKFFRAMGIG